MKNTMEMMKGVFKMMGDLFSICSNYTMFITFFGIFEKIQIKQMVFYSIWPHFI